MFANRRQAVLSVLTFLLLLLGMYFLAIYEQDSKAKNSLDHPTKLIYPDMKVATELVSLNLVEEFYTNDDSIEYNLDTSEFYQNEQLHKKIQQIIKTPQLEGALLGISVRKATSGELLYSNLGDIRLRPASNMKLLTAIASLKTLGENYHFTTDILTDGEINSNVLDGNIYVRGQGDPTLLKKDFDRFAEDLREQGIHKITGSIIGDDYWYDDVRYSPDLNWSDEYNYTGAAVSALTISPNEDYNTGSVVIRVYPSKKIGEPPHVETIPNTDYIKIINKAKTVRKQEMDKLTIERAHGTNNFIVDGSITVDSAIELWRSVWEPTEYVLHVFKNSLETNGIKLSDQTKIKRGKTPKDSKVLISKKSMPLKELLMPFMKLSNNGHGEMLIKEMGKVIYDEGSWDKGLQVMEEQLSNIGINTKNILLRDGSGMSHKNLIPPNELTKLLFEIQKEDWYEVFLNSQPVAGESDQLVGGTLRYRLTDESTKGRVRAKTGTLTGVSTLSGYLDTQEGEELIFSIMINNYVDGWMPSVQDAIVKILTEHQNIH